MCVILDLCKTRGRGKKTWNGAPFLIFTGAPKVLSEFAPRGYVILDTPLIMKDLQWPSLEQIRKTNKLAIMYKIQNDQIAIPIPHYLHRQTAHTRQFHPLRFRTVAIHSDTYKHSFFPRTIKDWNSLTPSMYDAKSLVVFKQCIQNV